jgi:hypothetical protein
VINTRSYNVQSEAAVYTDDTHHSKPSHLLQQHDNTPPRGLRVVHSNSCLPESLSGRSSENAAVVFFPLGTIYTRGARLHCVARAGLHRELCLPEDASRHSPARTPCRREVQGVKGGPCRRKNRPRRKADTIPTLWRPSYLVIYKKITITHNDLLLPAYEQQYGRDPSCRPFNIHVLVRG